MALVPDDVKSLLDHGFEVAVSPQAGAGSAISDDAYMSAGALIDNDTAMSAAAVVSVGGPEQLASAGMSHPSGTVFVGVFDPLWAPHRAQWLADHEISAFSLDLVPRITRAQSMDILSSMATVAGYEAVLLAASYSPQMFPLMMTAAGTLTPARVLVLGAGVAGLQAIATARRLGAVVEGYDVRPAALEQIRSMGARALELDTSTANAPDGGTGESAEGAGGYARAQSDDATRRQQEMLAAHVASADVVLTTAAIPGRASPLLVTTEMVDAMKPGAVLVDLAIARGGNCAVTKADTEVVRNGVTVLGPTDLVSRSARHASQMFSHNLTMFLKHIASDGEIVINTDDEITAAMLVTHGGAVVHPDMAAAAESSTTMSDTDISSGGAGTDTDASSTDTSSGGAAVKDDGTNDATSTKGVN